MNQATHSNPHRAKRKVPKRSVPPFLLKAMRRMVKNRLKKVGGSLPLAAPGFVLRVRIYLDHQNFYYNIAERYGYRLIDLIRLFEKVLQEHYRKQYLDIKVKVEKLIVFGAHLSGKSGNDQTDYFCALAEHSKGRIEFEFGKVERSHKSGRLVGEKSDGKGHLFVSREEKNSDTNLVGEAIFDMLTFVLGLDCNYHLRCVVSNDGDMKKALEIMRRIGFWGAVLAPLTDWSSTPVAESLEDQVLQKNLVRSIRLDQIEASLLPPRFGEYRCPEGW